jgi:hypothetical protein
MPTFVLIAPQFLLLNYSLVINKWLSMAYIHNSKLKCPFNLYINLNMKFSELIDYCIKIIQSYSPSQETEDTFADQFLEKARN